MTWRNRSIHYSRRFVTVLYQKLSVLFPARCIFGKSLLFHRNAAGSGARRDKYADDGYSWLLYPGVSPRPYALSARGLGLRRFECFLIARMVDDSRIVPSRRFELSHQILPSRIRV